MRVIVQLCRVVGSDLLNHSARSISNRPPFSRFAAVAPAMR